MDLDLDLDLDFDLGLGEEEELDLDTDLDFDLGLGGEDEDYSAIRTGIVNTLESATGWGTEADALIRRLTGEADSFDEAHKQSMADVAYFEEDSKYANYLTTGVGFAAGFLIPGLAMSKVGTVATTAQKAGAALKAAGWGALEGAVYGAGHGHTAEERLKGAAMGATAGGALVGGLGYKFLIKSDEELAVAAKKLAKQKGRGSHLGGEEGYVNSAAAKSSQASGKEAGLDTRSIVGIDDAAKELTDIEEAAGGTWFNLGRGMKSWMERHVGGRFAKLSEDAEGMSRRGRFRVDKSIAEDIDMQHVSTRLTESPTLKNLLVRINSELDDSSRLNWSSAANLAENEADRAAIKTLESRVKALQMQDPRNLRIMKDGTLKYESADYMPTEALKKIKREGSMGITDDYDSPLEAYRKYAHEVSDMLEMTSRFGVAPADVIKHANKKTSEGKYSNSLTEAVILSVKDRAKRETPDITAATLHNMEIGLRSQFVASRQGGNAMGSVMRRATSIALLANPMNAVLNMVEGITAPIYQNGVMAWMETIPEGIVSTFSKKAGAKSFNWIDDASTGHGGQWMGELANTGKSTFKANVADLTDFGVLNIPSVGGVVDKVGEVAYKVTGVDTVNRMGREMLGNSAIKRGMKLARKAVDNLDGKAHQKLMDHDGMRGLSETEARKTVTALSKLSKKGKSALDADEMMWVQNFYGSSLNKWQPVSASTLPKAFHDNPNGRVAYSMLSYMNRQMNNIIDDIGGQMAKAQAAGLNTPAGQRHMRKAYKNGAKYAGLFGVLAGTWNTARMGLDPSKENAKFTDVFSVEGMSEAAVNDLASNMTMGLLNIRAEQYGKKVGSIESIIPAPATAAGKIAGGLFDLATGEGTEELAKAAQTYVPVVSNVDRLYRIGTGNRLLTDDGSGSGFINDPMGALKEVGIQPTKSQGLFDDLGI